MAERAARAALDAAGRDPDLHEIGLLACDDARIAELNGQFRGKPQPTNVLCWPAFAGEVPARRAARRGAALPRRLSRSATRPAPREAAAAGIPLADHAAHLVVHGVLHLLGHDHEEDEEAEAMEALETKVLASMGVANPYSA